MTVDQYEAWIKSHQLQANNVNIADAVMGFFRVCLYPPIRDQHLDY